MIDLLIVNSIGPAFTSKTEHLGGSELEIIQVAHGLARLGHRVVVANAITKEVMDDGVRYIPFAAADGLKVESLWIERSTQPPSIYAKRIVIRATDVFCAPYETHRGLLESGTAAVAFNTRWQGDGFSFAKEKILIPPILDYDLGGPAPAKVPGLFVYASAPMKGLVATLELWRGLHRKHKKVLRKAKLKLALPGQSGFYGDLPVTLTDEDKSFGVSYAPSPNLTEYRRIIASAEGLFYGNRMPETFCCAGAFAERFGTRTHILCLNGMGGLGEALVNTSLVTIDQVEFERSFMEAWQSAERREKWYATNVPNRSAEAILPQWEEALRLVRGRAPEVGATPASAPPATGTQPGATHDAATDPRMLGQHVGHYPNTLYGGQAQRYWVHTRVLVGGSILGDEDAATLLNQHGVTHVLSAEHDRKEEPWPRASRGWFGFDDDGQDVPEALIHGAMDYAEKVLADPKTVLYAHCRMGGSRGPSMGYLVLRSVFGYTPGAAMKVIRAGRGAWTPHLRYIESIERAMTSRKGRVAAPGTARAQVIEAYRDTPTPMTKETLASLRPEEVSAESTFQQEEIPENLAPMPEEFGTHLALLRASLSNGGSEMGLGLILQALVGATRASLVVEIGRFRGFSTLALAQGLALADTGWTEPRAARQRPDVDYRSLLGEKKRLCYSIDPFPTTEADALLERAGLTRYVQKIDKRSEDVNPAQFGPIDVLLLDGAHDQPSVRADVARYVPHVRPGGYFVMHDYFGWYDGKGQNGSPIKKVIDEDLAGFEQVLIDTGFASFAVFRKTRELDPQPAKAPPRADGRPTVGLVMIAMGSESETVVARAIISAWKMVDAVTVVIDPAGGGEKTAEVARHIGADVYLRPTPKYDWEKGIGAIAGARNDALAIAEKKTDYVLMLDADDTLEGEIPQKLTHDRYVVPIHDGGSLYPRIQLWKSGRGYFYEGIIHEHLVCAGTSDRLSTLRYMRRFGGGHQDSVPASVKYMRHARLVSKWLIDHPDDSRAQFYLAQSYKDAGKGDDAIREYEKRIAMTTGNEEERAFSAFQIARITRDHGKDPTAAYLRAYELDPRRAEPLCDLAVWLREANRRRFALAVLVAKRAADLPLPGDAALFVEPATYQWRSLEEYAIASYWSGDKREALRVYEILRTRVPDGMRGHIESSIAMCRREVG
jgi:predicted O-methyltransferase YrrM